MNDRLRHIDGLRGVAVLGVIFFHTAVHNAAITSRPQTALTFLLRQGCHGVDLFFIISGFCLAYPALAAVHAKGRTTFKLAAYAARRVGRIVPPYYAAIGCFVFLGWALTARHIALPQPMAADALSLDGVIKQALFLDRDRQFLDASFWTLAIEFRWYFVFPVILWLWVHFPKAFGAVAILAVAAGSTRVAGVDIFFLPFFMMGVAAAELHVRGLRVSTWGVGILAVMIAAATISTAGKGWYFIENGPLWGIAMFAVVVGVGAIAPLRRAASSRWLVAVGSASYGIYLVHEPVVALIESAMPARVGSAVVFASAIVGGLAIGMLFSFVAERPFMTSVLRERITARLERVFQTVFCRLGASDGVALHRDSSSRVEEVLRPV